MYLRFFFFRSTNYFSPLFSRVVVWFKVGDLRACEFRNNSTAEGEPQFRVCMMLQNYPPFVHYSSFDMLASPVACRFEL